MSGSSGGLSALVQQAEQLISDIEGSGDLPHVHRNLSQIQEAGQRLLDKTSGVQDGQADVKA